MVKLSDFMVQRWRQMLAFQDEIYPFTPTYDELMVVWGLSRTGAFYTLKKLDGAGVLWKRERSDGTKTSYYAKKESEL